MKLTSMLGLASSVLFKRKYKILFAGIQFALLIYTYWKNRDSNKEVKSLPSRLMSKGKKALDKADHMLYDK